MEAGRELDALIAKKIFNEVSFVLYPEKCPQCGAQVPDDYFHFAHQRHSYSKGRTCMLGHFLPKTPSYSTDIAAAWLVVEQFEAVARIERSFPASGDKLWFVELCKDIESFSGSAETAPHAICLAALESIDP